MESTMEIIQQLEAGKGAGKEDILQLLKLEGDQLRPLFEAAQRVREKNFGNRIFLYGFVYFSTFCRNDCNFCYYRKSNDIERYRKTPEEVLAIVRQLYASGVHLIDLTMGEDLSYRKDDFDMILEIIRQIKEETTLPVMISPGILSRAQTDRFTEIGTDWYALYQETHNRELYKELRWDQDYDERMDAKLYARETGMLVEEGILVGVGENLADIADSILAMESIGATQVRVMSFVPQEGSPMEGVKTPDRDLELKIISIFRLLYPTALIPASLDVDGIAGLEARMNAGANVVTSIIPPRSGFAGVAQNSMDVDAGGRTVEEASKILKNLGLECATAQEYSEYIKKKGRKE